MTKRQIGQYGYGLSYGQCQIFLQSSEGYDLHCVEQQTQPHFLQTAYVSHWPLFVFANDDVPLQGEHFVIETPIANFQEPNLNDYRQYDLLGAGSQDLAQTRQLLSDGRIFDCFCPAQRANSLLCEPKALGVLLPQPEHGVINYAVECLTSLIAHCQDYLLSNVHLYRVFQSKIRSFGSPVGGV